MTSTFERDIGGKNLVIETGKLAQQANGSVVLRDGDNVFLVTVVMAKPREGIDFFPLTIEFEERFYSRGKIPGGFFRREGRPSTHGTLVARLTDRPIRPLFPAGFKNEIQLVITPMSLDDTTPLDVYALSAASLALSISDIPFEGPIAATRVGQIDGEFVINPTYEQINESKLDILVAGSRDGVVMMEAAANELSESIIEEAIELAQERNLEVIDFQDEIVSSIGKPKSEWTPNVHPEELNDKIEGLLNGRIASTFDASNGKAEQSELLGGMRSEAIEAFGEEFDNKDILNAFEELLEKEFKHSVLTESKRPDGRGVKEIRKLEAETSLLPRAHGTGLFSRGETQILGIVTLGSVGDAQKLDNLTPEASKRFMLHYNFPPYSVGEARRMGSPGRREIGHGMLAERALTPVLPSEEDFPYTLRLVCEALGSNGSTSMASVCAGSLALMDAGVPIKTPVAGISVGLVIGDDGEYVTLTDIQGLEDHVGDMDFKVAGTKDGITAIQLDIKAKSITMDMVHSALAQAREARGTILETITDTLGEAREEMSEFAPRMLTIKIPVDKIGTVIGPGGKMIRSIVEQTSATVDIQDDGTVLVGSSDLAAAEAAKKMIDDLTREIKAGEIFTGKVVRIMDFGAFVQILPGKDGLVHISEIADYRVERVEDELNLGDEVTVLVREIDSMGRVNLSRRALLRPEGEEGESGDNGNAPQGRPSGDRPSGDRRGGGRPGGGGRQGGGGDRRGGGGGRPQGGGDRRGGYRSGPPRES